MKCHISKCLAIAAVFLGASNVLGGPLPPHTLSLDEAITRGLQANVNVIVARARVDEATGTLERKKSAYLPHVRVETPVTYQTRDLRVMGIPSNPAIPSVVGPYASYDLRAYGDQTIFDLQSYYNIKAGEKDKKARVNDYEDVRSLIIRQVAVNYIGAQYAVARVETAESRVRTSETLEDLARHQREVGLADGLDVLRAQVQLANDRQNLLVAKNSYEQSLLALARTIGNDMATPIALADRLAFKRFEPPQIEPSVRTALENRPDYHSLLSQRESVKDQLKSSRSRYLPKFVISGNYGGGGNLGGSGVSTSGGMEPTGVIQGNLVMTLFDMDRKGERLQLESRLKQVEQQIADQKQGVEQDIREALLNLQSADEQVNVARSGLELAERELQFASDRFKNGVTNNVEVVNAQDSLSRAHDNNINALAKHAEAKIALARALGNTDKTYRSFLGIP